MGILVRFCSQFACSTFELACHLGLLLIWNEFLFVEESTVILR